VADPDSRRAHGLENARRFLREHHRGVLATRRDGGAIQQSPVLVKVDAEGRAIVSSRETALKTRNLRRDSWRRSVCSPIASSAAACVVVDQRVHRLCKREHLGALSRSFHSEATYIWLDEAARHGVDFAMHGPQFSRGFAALKVWDSLLAHGRAAYGRRIAHDVALTEYLGTLVERTPTSS